MVYGLVLSYRKLDFERSIAIINTSFVLHKFVIYQYLLRFLLILVFTDDTSFTNWVCRFFLLVVALCYSCLVTQNLCS